MKRHVLTAIMLLSVAYAFSQTARYFPFPESNAVWLDSTCGRISWEMTGDTMLNNITYHKLKRMDYLYPLSISQLCEYWEPPAFHSFYAGAIRQDTAMRKVYFLPPGSSSDTLLYDFNLAVGDTVKTYITWGGETGSVVTAIDSLWVGAQYRKIWKISAEHWPFTVIEGIGSTRGPVDPIAPIGGYSQYDTLICFSHNNQTLFPYFDPTSGCDPLTGIAEEPQTEPISVSPNPSTGKFVIETEMCGNLSVKIFDLNGMLLFRQNISGKTDMFVPDLKEGVYILTVQSDAATAMKKLVIMR